MKGLKKFIITWLILFLIIEFVMSMFGIGKSKDTEELTSANTILIEATNNKFTVGKGVRLNVSNFTKEPITIVSTDCMPALDVFIYKNGVWEEVVPPVKDVCPEALMQPIELAPTEKAVYSFKFWNYDMFGTTGRYKAVLNIGEKEFSTPEFIIKDRGFIKRSWDFLFFKPIYNGIIFFVDLTPGHSLGIAIIILTFVIRLILLIPSQKALRSQRRMQEIQPKIQEIQRKYKGNQEKIAMETMAVWKNAKASPMGSCLPMLIQFPVLIALYYGVREVAFGGNAHLLYEIHKDFDFSTINTMFLGVMNLADRNLIVLPIIIGLLQFFQMKLTFSMKKAPAKSTPKKEGVPDMNTMNKTMTYTMPLMIAFFTATLPSGVGLYWGTSTLFGIGQTIMVNREKPNNGKKNTNTDEVTVKVVEPTPEEKREEEKQKYLPQNKKNN